MLTRLGFSVSTIARQVGTHCRRNIGISAVVCNKAQTAELDPIQQLFITKINEYSQKSKKSGGKVVDVSPEDEKMFKDDLAKIDRQYMVKGQDMAQFPAFEFRDPASLQQVDIDGNEEEIKRMREQIHEETSEADKGDENRISFDV